MRNNFRTGSRLVNKAFFLIGLFVIVSYLLSPLMPRARAESSDCPAFDRGNAQAAEKNFPEIYAVGIEEAIKKSCVVIITNALIKGELEVLSGQVDRLEIKGSIFTGQVFVGNLTAASGISFQNSTFRESAEFELLKGKGQVGLDFTGATFEKRLKLQEIDSLDLQFVGATAKELTEFYNIKFVKAELTAGSFNEIDWIADFGGELWPPATINTVKRGLDWEIAKAAKPDGMSQDDFFGQWENVFSGARLHSDTKKIRIERRHSFLLPLVFGLGIGFLSIVLLFGAFYLIWFRSNWWHEKWWVSSIARYMFFSFDVSTPGIDAAGMAYFRRAGIRPAEIPLVIFVQRFLGWMAMLGGGAVALAWVIQ